MGERRITKRGVRLGAAFFIGLVAAGCGPGEEAAPPTATASGPVPSLAPSGEQNRSQGPYCDDGPQNRQPLIRTQNGHLVYAAHSECVGSAADPAWMYRSPRQDRSQAIAALVSGTEFEVLCYKDEGQYIRSNEAGNPPPGESHHTGSSIWLHVRVLTGEYVGTVGDFPTTNAGFPLLNAANVTTDECPR